MFIKDLDCVYVFTCTDGKKSFHAKGVLDNGAKVEFEATNLETSCLTVEKTDGLKSLNLSFSLLPDENKNFYTIKFEPKKMTKEEIEKKLGYPIEIVDEGED